MRLDFEHSCSGARNGWDQNKSPDGALTARSGLMVLVYDRPLLRSSARGDGALKQIMIASRLRLRKPLREHLREVIGENCVNTVAVNKLNIQWCSVNSV